MATLLDTDVLIHLRDGDHWVESQVRHLVPPFFISAPSRVELENGVAIKPSKVRIDSLEKVLSYVATIPFGPAEVDAFRGIVRAIGYSRRKTVDRMTAATALANNLPLVTLNYRDFRDVPGLAIIEWDRPAD